MATGREMTSSGGSRTGQVAGDGLLGERVGGAHGSSVRVMTDLGRCSALSRRLFTGALGCRFSAQVTMRGAQSALSRGLVQVAVATNATATAAARRGFANVSLAGVLLCRSGHLGQTTLDAHSTLAGRRLAVHATTAVGFLGALGFLRAVLARGTILQVHVHSKRFCVGLLNATICHTSSFTP